MEPNPSNAAKPDSAYVTAMSHFYRGEIGRIMAWRSRLDTTTNWAITVSSSIFTVAFSLRDVPHFIFFFNIAVVTMLLWMEARRYRHYDAFHARVRMIEAHFLVPIVSANSDLLHGDWQRLLCADLLLPSFKISKREAIGRRLRRNYGFIYLIVLGAWVTKIFLHSSHAITDFASFYAALGVGQSIPGWFVFGVFTMTVAAVLGGIVWAGRTFNSEISDFSPHRDLWRI